MKDKKLWFAASAILIIGLLIAWQWWRNQQSALPDGITSGNGRIEAVQVSIATKYSGRIHEILVEEGDMVKSGQILARMDTEEITAALAEARARLSQAEEAIAEAAAVIIQSESALIFAEQELARAIPLAKRGSLSQRQAEQRKSARDSAKAALDVAKAHKRTMEKSVEAAQAAVNQVETRLSEYDLRAPANGRVLYRLVEPGEVLGAGGRVLMLLDLDDIYMEIFLPEQQAPRIAIGTEARITIDAFPQYVIPAKVSFVSPEAQFTPKQVETHSEREKLMFRAKIKVPHDVVAPHIAKVKTGVRGIAYIRLDNTTAWPPNLKISLPKEKSE